jgi:hypothetical protein
MSTIPANLVWLAHIRPPHLLLPRKYLKLNSFNNLIRIWTTNKLLIELHGQLFDRVWESLPTIQFQQGKKR